MHYKCYFDQSVSCTPNGSWKDSTACGHIGKLYGVSTAAPGTKDWTWCTPCRPQDPFNFSPQLLDFADAHDIRWDGENRFRYINNFFSNKFI